MKSHFSVIAELPHKYLTTEPLLPGLQLDGTPSNKPAVASHSEELHDGLYTEVHSAGKDLAPGDAPSEMHQLPQVDSCPTSPKYQRHETPLNVDPEPFQSLAKIQRSKSRQRAFELRDSAKPAKSSSCIDNDICVHSSVLFESGIRSSNSSVVHESELGFPSQLKDGQDRDQLSDCVSASPSSGVKPHFLVHINFVSTYLNFLSSIQSMRLTVIAFAYFRKTMM